MPFSGKIGAINSLPQVYAPCSTILKNWKKKPAKKIELHVIAICVDFYEDTLSDSGNVYSNKSVPVGCVVQRIQD